MKSYLLEVYINKGLTELGLCISSRKFVGKFQGHLNMWDFFEKKLNAKKIGKTLAIKNFLQKSLLG